MKFFSKILLFALVLATVYSVPFTTCDTNIEKVGNLSHIVLSPLVPRRNNTLKFHIVGNGVKWFRFTRISIKLSLGKVPVKTYSIPFTKVILPGMPFHIDPQIDLPEKLLPGGYNFQIKGKTALVVEGFCAQLSNIPILP